MANQVTDEFDPLREKDYDPNLLPDTTLKTLKDIEITGHGPNLGEIRDLAIEWVKEDFRLIKEGPLADDSLTWLWMKRLNITEDDLK